MNLFYCCLIVLLHLTLASYNFGLGSCHSNGNTAKNVARIYQTPSYNPKLPLYTNWKLTFGEVTETKVCIKITCNNGASECAPVKFSTCENSSSEHCVYASKFEPKNFYILARADGVCAPKKEEIRDGVTGPRSPHITTKQYRNGNLIADNSDAMPSKFWGDVLYKFLYNQNMKSGDLICVERKPNSNVNLKKCIDPLDQNKIAYGFMHPNDRIFSHAWCPVQELTFAK